MRYHGGLEARYKLHKHMASEKAQTPECPNDELVPVVPLLDAAELLDFDQVEQDWKATLRERETVEADTQRAFRDEPGSPTPASVVQSAEGPMLFPGLHVSNNGPLSKVARAALQETFPAGAEPPADDDA
jgi:hypothetical protein